MDEVIDVAGVLRLSFGDANLGASGLEIPSVDDDGPRWHVDAAGLMGDLVLERRVLAYADTLARDLSRQRPEEIHRLRIAPYGSPPSAGSHYRALFDFFDQQTRLRFVMSIDQLEQAFAGETRRKLPATARHQRGWWSNPRLGKDGRPRGVGAQRQRAAWLTAGYEATNVQVERNPHPMKNAERLELTSSASRSAPSLAANSGTPSPACAPRRRDGSAEPRSALPREPRFPRRNRPSLVRHRADEGDGFPPVAFL